VSASAQSANSITVSWNSVSGANSYYVYRASNSYGTYSYIVSTSSVSYTDTGLSANTAYYYKVSAYNNYGESPQSTSYGYATTSGTAPSAPSSVSASAQSANSITVSWNSVSGASSYYVYRASSSSGTYSYIVSTISVSYTDTGLSANTAYYYKVSARNDYGESPQSTSYGYATTSGTAPSAPSSVSASAQSANSITVSWDSVSGASSYYVYRASSSSGTYSYVVSTGSVSYTDTGLSENTSYYYKVSAYNNYGESPQSTSYGYATTLGTWGLWEGYLSPGEVHYYGFNASSGYYQIFWEDLDYFETYGDIRVSAIDNNGTYLFNKVDAGYDGQRVYVPFSGYITLEVEGYDYSSSGNYRIGFARE
jgi:fibronectin type 3 domain-containing protein